MVNRIDVQPCKSKPWRGYSIDELRYRIAVNIVRQEVEKERVIYGLGKLYEENTVPKTGMNILKRIAGALNIMDYAVLSFRLGRRLYSLYKRFRR